MNIDELSLRLDIIFKKERVDTDRLDIIENKIISKNGKLLFQIYANINQDKELVNFFNDYILQKVELGSSREALLSVYFLSKNDNQNNLGDSLESRNTNGKNIKIFLKGLSFFSEYKLLNLSLKKTNSFLDSLNIIQEQNVRWKRVDPELWNNLKSLKQNLLTQSIEIIKEEIKGINLEINRDKEQVQNIIEYLKFDNKYNVLLNKIDNYIESNDKLINSGMISNLRTFMSDLAINVAKKIASKENEDIEKINGQQEIGNCRIYNKRKLGLSDSENSLINQYINILHAEGGHGFMSDKKYFRLAKNMGIEIALFLLSKYKEKFE